MAYAERTQVDVNSSRDEIEQMLDKRGSTAFLAGNRDKKMFIAFQLDNLQIKFEIPMPKIDEFKKTETGRKRTEKVAQKELEQAQKQRWRALFLSIKAKLISIEEGIETFEQAFLAHIVISGGATVGENLIPRLRESVINAEIKLLTD